MLQSEFELIKNDLEKLLDELNEAKHSENSTTKELQHKLEPTNKLRDEIITTLEQLIHDYETIKSNETLDKMSLFLDEADRELLDIILKLDNIFIEYDTICIEIDPDSANYSQLIEKADIYNDFKKRLPIKGLLELSMQTSYKLKNTIERISVLINNEILTKNYTEGFANLLYECNKIAKKTENLSNLESSEIQGLNTEISKQIDLALLSDITDIQRTILWTIYNEMASMIKAEKTIRSSDEKSNKLILEESENLKRKEESENLKRKEESENLKRKEGFITKYFKRKRENSDNKENIPYIIKKDTLTETSSLYNYREFKNYAITRGVLPLVPLGQDRNIDIYTSGGLCFGFTNDWLVNISKLLKNSEDGKILDGILNKYHDEDISSQKGTQNNEILDKPTESKNSPKQKIKPVGNHGFYTPKARTNETISQLHTSQNTASNLPLGSLHDNKEKCINEVIKLIQNGGGLNLALNGSSNEGHSVGVCKTNDGYMFFDSNTYLCLCQDENVFKNFLKSYFTDIYPSMPILSYDPKHLRQWDLKSNPSSKVKT